MLRVRTRLTQAGFLLAVAMNAVNSLRPEQTTDLKVKPIAGPSTAWICAKTA